MIQPDINQTKQNIHIISKMQQSNSNEFDNTTNVSAPSLPGQSVVTKGCSDNDDVTNNNNPTKSYFQNEDNPDKMFVRLEHVSLHRFVLYRKNNDSFSKIEVRDEDKEDMERLVQDAGNNSIVTSSQLKAMDNEILNKINIDKYLSYEKFEEKSQFFVNLIMDNGLQNNVLKFDESSKQFRRISVEEIYQYLKTKFSSRSRTTTNSTSTTKKMKQEKGPTKLSPKKKHTTSSQGAKTNNYISTWKSNHPLKTSLKFGNIYYDLESQDTWSKYITRYDMSEEDALKEYKKENYINEESHSFYSVIHPLYDEYELNIWNGSHRLKYHQERKGRTCIHANTKIRLKIPSPIECNMKSFFVLFNSKLVHGGSKSCRESLLSMHSRYNFRLFSFIIQSYHDTRMKLSPGAIDEKLHPTQNVELLNTRKDEIDHNSFEICDPDTCNVCEPHRLKTPELEIDVRREYMAKKEYVKRMKSRNKVQWNVDLHGVQRPDSYVCGDLDEHGWEVHEGIDYMRDNRYKFLRMHIDVMNNISERDWSNILGNNGRSFVRFENLSWLGRRSKQVELSGQFILDYCFKDLSHKLSQIRGFQQHSRQGEIFFTNKKVIPSQQPHRDYVRLKHAQEQSSATGSKKTTPSATISSNQNKANNTGQGVRSTKRARRSTDRYTI